MATHWSTCPNGLGIIIGDFHICEPEEGRFDVVDQTTSDGDPGWSTSFGGGSAKLHKEGGSAGLGRHESCPGLSQPSMTFPCLMLVAFHVTDFRDGSSLSDHVAIRYPQTRFQFQILRSGTQLACEASNSLHHFWKKVSVTCLVERHRCAR